MKQTSELSRRSMIGALAMAGAGARSSAANSAVTVGLIGCGDRGLLVTRFLAKNPNARLVSICDLFDDKIERAKHEIPVESPRVFKDYRELLASDVDAVIVATPVYAHPEHFEAVVKARKHMYIEKPAAPDVAGCKRIIQAAEHADPKLEIVFGLQARYGPGYHKAKAILDAGGIGPLHQAHAHFIKGDVTGREPIVPHPRTEAEKVLNWKPWRDLGGDIIVETYCHGIDVLNWFCGGHAVKAFGSGGRTLRRDGDFRDHVNVVFTYPSGVEASLAGSQITAPFYRSAMEQFFGAKGTLETSRQYWTHYRGPNDAPTEKFPVDITKDAVDEFVERIRTGKPENTGARSAESTLTAILGRMAMDEKREVGWDEMMASG